MTHKRVVLTGLLVAATAIAAILLLSVSGSPPDAAPPPRHEPSAAEAPYAAPAARLAGAAQAHTAAARDADAGSEPTPPEGPAPPKPPRSLMVEVRGWKRKPLAGAEVTVRAWGTGEEVVRATNDAGRATFEHPSAAVDLGVVCDGYAKCERQGLLLEPDSEVLPVSLAPVTPLQVRVVDATSGLPIARAQVSARESSVEALDCAEFLGTSRNLQPAVTDERGRATLEGVRLNRSYAIWALAAGYDHGARSFSSCAPGDAREVELRLRPGGKVRARLLDADGLPASDRRVTVVAKGSALDQTCEGTVPPQPTERREEEEDLDRSVPAPPLVGSYWIQPSYSIDSALTDEEGYATIEGLDLGRTYVVSVHADGLLGFALGGEQAACSGCEVTLTRETPDVSIQLRLVETPRLCIQCEDDRGRPLAGVTCTHVEWSGSVYYPREVRSDEGGLLRLEEALPGAQEVGLERTGYAPVHLDVVCMPGEPAVRARFVPLAPLEGRVLDPGGRPFSDAWVAVQWDGARAPTRASDGSVPCDPAGRFDVQAAASGDTTLVYGARDSLERGEQVVAAGEENVVLTLARSQRIEVTARFEWAAGNAPRAARLRCLVQRIPKTWGTSAFVEKTPRGWLVLPGTYDCVKLLDGACELWSRRFEALEGGKGIDLGTIQLHAPAPVDGQVLFADGTPVPSARIRLPGTPWPTGTDGEGRFHLKAAPQREVSLIVGSDELPARRVEVAAPRPGEVWRIVVRANGYLSGRIAGAGAGDMGPGLRLDVTPADGAGRRPREEPRIDSFGHFFVALIPGPYEVSLLRGDEVVAHGTAVVREDEETRIALPIR